MSKIGKKPVLIPDNVQVSIASDIVTVKGPKGQLQVKLHPKVKVSLKDQSLVVTVKDEQNRGQRALWGTLRSLLENAVLGTSAGFEKKLEIIGVGYRASVTGGKLILNLGFSHPIELAIPRDLQVSVEKNIITISGVDKQQVGEFAAIIRSKRKPEPYKGKGIKYQDEVIRRKAGKVLKAVGT